MQALAETKTGFGNIDVRKAAINLVMVRAKIWLKFDLGCLFVVENHGHVVIVIVWRCRER